MITCLYRISNTLYLHTTRLPISPKFSAFLIPVMKPVSNISLLLYIDANLAQSFSVPNPSRSNKSQSRYTVKLKAVRRLDARIPTHFTETEFLHSPTETTVVKHLPTLHPIVKNKLQLAPVSNN